MSDISERIKKQRKILGLTQAQLASSVCVQPQAVSSWERSISAPKGKQLSALAKTLGVTKSWLLYGDSQESNDVHEFVTMVPFYDEVYAGAGHGFENFKNIKKQYPLPNEVVKKELNKQNIFCIRAFGNSMEPAFKDGAVLAVNSGNQEVQDGRIYVFRVNSRLRVKRVRSTNDGVVLESYNKDYPDEIILWPSFNDTTAFAIIGEVFWYSSKLNC
ncbi:TPA: S24 family peptidase [Vibrio parahaemolyticus]